VVVVFGVLAVASGVGVEVSVVGAVRFGLTPATAELGADVSVVGDVIVGRLAVASGESAGDGLDVVQAATIMRAALMIVAGRDRIR
jgi:hypothetical protein